MSLLFMWWKRSPTRSRSPSSVTTNSAEVPGVPGGFTIPGTAYAVAEDGQAVSVGGTFPPKAAPREPLPVTPQLTALLGSAVALLR